MTDSYAANNRVLILVNHDIVIYNFRKELIERLLKENYEIYISSPYGERIEKLKEIGCNYIDTSIDRHGMNPFKDLSLLFFYLKLMKRVRPFVVLTYTIKPNIYGCITGELNKIPCLANITGMGSSIVNGGIKQKISIMLYRIAFRHTKRVFFQNTENWDFFKKRKIIDGQGKLIPGSGVNLEQFRLLRYPTGELLPDGHYTLEFIFISRVMREKGIEEYLAAAEEIKEVYPYTRFHILGFCEESYEKMLQEYEKRHIITYHGMQDDITKFLSITHCTVHPSYHEGMSNVCLESAACGRPVITTDCSGCRETVDDGITGYLVEKANSKALSNVIERFIKLSYKEKRDMGIAGRKKMQREFNRHIVVDTYIKEIKELERVKNNGLV